MRSFNLALAIVGALWCAAAHAAPAWVQTQVSTLVVADGIITAFTYTLLHPFTAGDCIAGQMFIEETTYNLSSIKDNAGNTYTILDHMNDAAAANFFVATFALARVAGVPTTITANFSAPPANANNEFMVAEECSGAGFVDQHAMLDNTVATSTPTSGSVTTRGADLVLGFYYPETGTQPVAGSGFTLRDSDVGNGVFSETLGQTVNGAQAATFSQTPVAGTGVVGLVAFASCGQLALIGVGC